MLGLMPMAQDGLEIVHAISFTIYDSNGVLHTGRY